MSSWLEIILTALILYFFLTLIVNWLFPRFTERVGGVWGLLKPVRWLLKWVFKCIKWLFISLFRLVKRLISGSTQVSDLYGSADWLSRREMRKFFRRKNKGLLLDGHKKRLSEERSFHHMLMVGVSGSGKSSSVFIPNVVYLAKHMHSMVITDLKGEINQLTASYLRSQGYEILSLNLSDTTKSAVFNPLHRCRDLSDIKQLSRILISASFGTGKNKDSYWTKGAERIVTVLLFAAWQLEDIELRNISTVAFWLELIGTPEQKTLDRILAQYLPDKLMQTYQAFLNEPPEPRGSILSNARVALDPCNDPIFQAVTEGKDSLDFEALRTAQDGAVLFLNVPPKRMGDFGFLFTILYKQLLDFALEEPAEDANSIFFLLDEFANIPPIPDFANTITLARSYRISLLLGVQSLAQLSAYGDSEARTIQSNCSSLLVLPGVDIETAERLSRIAGDATVRYSEDGFGTDSPARDRLSQRKLMTPDEVRRLRDNEALYVYRNLKPVRLTMKRWFENRRMKRRLLRAQKVEQA